MDPRHWLLKVLFEHSHRPYAAVFKSNAAWGLRAETLRSMPPGTLGHTMGTYLHGLGYELIDKLESHDFCHLLTDTPTDIPGEIALQALLLGNGKRSLYLLGALFIGLLLFPEHRVYFHTSYRKGQQLQRFFDLDFHELLHTPYSWVRAQVSGEVVPIDLAMAA